MRCATDPDVETDLLCSRCGKPICSRCLVQTPVGARCRDCAHLRRIPTYDVAGRFLVRGIVAGLVVAVVGGVLWFALLPQRVSGAAYVALFLALALGYAMGEAVSWAANRKRGPVLQGVAAGGIVLAYVVRNLLEGSGAIGVNDVFGWVTVGIAIVVAMGRLR